MGSDAQKKGEASGRWIPIILVTLAFVSICFVVFSGGTSTNAPGDQMSTVLAAQSTPQSDFVETPIYVATEPPPPPPPPPGESLKELEDKEVFKRAQVQKIKNAGTVMEVDAEALKVTKELQVITEKLLRVRYADKIIKNDNGQSVVRINMDVTFPKRMGPPFTVTRQLYVNLCCRRSPNPRPVDVT